MLQLIALVFMLIILNQAYDHFRDVKCLVTVLCKSVTLRQAVNTKHWKATNKIEAIVPLAAWTAIGSGPYNQIEITKENHKHHLQGF